MNDYIIKGTTLTNIADAIRSKTGTSQPIDAGNFSAAIATIPTDPSGNCTATNADILQGKTAYAGEQLRTGTIPTKTSSDLSASGATVTVPSGYYASQVTKSISTGAVSATAYSNGNVHFNVTSAGYVDGSKNTYKQYSTQAATSITPSTSQQTAIAANTLATGAITVKAVDNVSAGNIKAGTSIAGVAGSLSPMNGCYGFPVSMCYVFGPYEAQNNVNQIIIPERCHKIAVTCVGSGGAGINIAVNSSYGAMIAQGGSGFVNYGVFDVTPGQVIPLKWGDDGKVGNYDWARSLCLNNSVLINNNAFANNGANVYFGNLLVGIGGEGARWYASNHTLKAGNGLCGGGIEANFHANTVYTKNILYTFIAGDGQLGGGGGIRFDVAAYNTFQNTRVALKAGNGGKYGGGGGVQIMWQPSAYNNIGYKSAVPGVGGEYGGNGFVRLWNGGSPITLVSGTKGTNAMIFPQSFDTRSANYVFSVLKSHILDGVYNGANLGYSYGGHSIGTYTASGIGGSGPFMDSSSVGGVFTNSSYRTDNRTSGFILPNRYNYQNSQGTKELGCGVNVQTYAGYGDFSAWGGFIVEFIWE